jgi:GNAT superfamily N-acetyltransferase
MGAGKPIEIHPSRADEREAIGAAARSTGVFTPEELDTVFELFDAYRDDPDSGYRFLTAAVDGTVAGFACYGPTSLTEGAFDFYWLTTDASIQKHGVGRALDLAVEREVRREGGRLIVIWTSGTDAYIPAVRFYERMGYIHEGCIHGFYRPGDDLLIFVKYLLPE